METKVSNHGYQRFKERGYSKSEKKIKNAFDKAWGSGKTIDDFKDHNQRKYLQNVRDAHIEEGVRFIRVLGNEIYLFGEDRIGITVIRIDSKYFNKGSRGKWRENYEEETDCLSDGYFWKRVAVCC